MKILHISGAKGWGGNEQQMIYLFPELKNLGVENIVFGVMNSKLQEECDKMKILFIEAKSKKLNKIANYSYLKKIIDRVKPDLIHLHTSDSLTVYTISDIIYKLNTKTVFSKKGMGTSSSFLSKIKYNYKGINSIICVSNSVQRDLGMILNIKTQSKIVVIHDCVSLDVLDVKTTFNLRESFNIADNFKIIGNIANHSNAKDLPTFINVVDHVVNELKYKDFKFVQIGEFTKNTSQLQQMIIEKRLENYIFFTDKIENASSVVNQFDLFLLTSQREGGPTSVLEAMLIGIPVISTKVGVIPDIIENGINGFVYDVKDYKNLAEKINILLSNTELQKKFVETSKQKLMKEFTAEFIAKQTLTLYENILD
jgi:glycosyltransferase involved in cell wall biosynthesis